MEMLRLSKRFSSCPLAFVILTLCNRFYSAEGLFLDPNGTLFAGSDDGHSSAIDIPVTFPFYGLNQSMTSLYVTSNGAITFENGLGATVGDLPHFRDPAVLPMWGDFDPTEYLGAIYHRNATADELDMIEPVVGLRPTWAIVISFIDMPWYDLETANYTCQVILATDEVQSLALFVYDEIAHRPIADYSEQIVVGFDRGNAQDYYSHTWSDTEDISMLVNTSNICVEGYWLYNIGESTIEEVSRNCHDDEDDDDDDDDNAGAYNSYSSFSTMLLAVIAVMLKVASW